MIERINGNIGVGHTTATKSVSETIQKTATGHSLTGGAGARGEVRIWTI